MLVNPKCDSPDWLRVFSTAFTLERELQDEFDGRLRRLPGGHRVSRGVSLPNGSIMDCLITDCETGLPRALVEYKRPVYQARGRMLKELDVLAHIDQVINYGTQLLLLYPQLAFLPFILTNGWSFLAAYGQRSSLGHLELYVCETPLSLYNWGSGTMGSDFALFWKLCTYNPIPLLSLDLQLPDAPGIVVKVEKCIGHGASSFVYQGSLIENSMLAGSNDLLHLQLEAAGSFAIKIPKERSDNVNNVWGSEMWAIEQFVKADVQNCCVFPLYYWGHGQRMIIYPLGIPVVPTVSTKPAEKSPLKLKHFAGLLRDLRAMHTASVVHRDVRLPNILIVGDEAKLTDFGFSSPPGDVQSIVGTMETASQAVLAAALKGAATISYGPRDDLESLLKVFLMHQYDFKVPPAEGKNSWTKTVYRAWKWKIRGHGIEGMEYEELAAYLERLFDSREERWEQHTGTPFSSTS